MSRAARSATERALGYVERASRVRIQDPKDNPGARTSGRQTRKSTNQAGHTQGALERAAKPPPGWIWGDFFRPWHRMFPGQKHFNADINVRREYHPLSLAELSRLIDLGWVDASRPIDVAALCATGKFRIDPRLRQAGIHLTPEGADSFSHRVDVEVQWACARTAAAIESAGGRLTTAYYDAHALEAAVKPKEWFMSGRPVPARKAPPPSLMEFYSSAVNRGYLADATELIEAKKTLALTMGYTLPEQCVEGEGKPMDRVFHGIPSGAIVSLRDKKVFGPTHPVVKAYYETPRADYSHDK